MSTPESLKIEKTNLTDEVYSRIRELIRDGSWQEGEKIPGEVQLSGLFNVSRAVIREALQRLRSEKCIVTRHGIGSFVANPENYSGSTGPIELSEDTYAQMVEFRESVEFAAMELAENSAVPADLKALRAAMEHMESTAPGSEAYSEADYEFHRAVVACAHNGFLLRAYEANRAQIIAVFKEMNRVPESAALSSQVHGFIVEGIENHRGREVIGKIRKHDAYNRVRMAELRGKQ